MRRRTIRLALVGPLLVLALGAMSGCGNADADEGVPSANGGAAAPQQSGNAGSGDAQKYAQCIRENGVPDFPDPNPNGGFGDVRGLDRAALQKAMQACQDQAPAGVGNASQQMAPDQVEKWTKFAGCMRDNGVDIPDPDPNGSLQDWAKSWAGGANRSDKFQKASETCQQKASISFGGSGR